ncbi:M23 family peptidase [Nocardia farcinica]|uniref:C40 family peptidase n=1 Tax=Nocardia farcinica TaxID=37329 RepID=UPI000DFEBFEF|nr:NlpC/P60 family protein [Nocardia farcinica]SUE28925.1 M23 family peptidase [Nocardia farcinica]
MHAPSRTVAATALGLPVALLLVLLVAIAADPKLTCTTPLSAVTATGVDGPTGQTVAGLSEAQLQLARNGVAIGRQRGMPEPVIIAELAAQATESTFRNLANPAVPQSLNYPNDGLGFDHDSVGPHQMRASIWGAVGIATLMDPIYQINWFYDRAESLGATAEALSPAALAQEIERSAPNAYSTHLGLARRLFALFSDIDPASMPRTPAHSPATGCGPHSPGAPLPAEASDFGRAVIEHGTRWMGTPYVWGGGDTDGPTGGGFDCSGLTLYAIYHASGGRIRLPHYTQAQQDHPSAQVVAFADRVPGDLIFFTAPGEADSHHVGIYYGTDDHGRDLLLHAPQSGQTVTLTPLTAWNGEHMDVRRYATPAPSDTTDPGGRTI